MNATRIGSIIQINDASHAWGGKRVLIVDVEYGYLGGIERFVTELLEQQSLPYGSRLICQVRPESTVNLSDNQQLQTTNQMPIGFETIKNV